MEKLTQLSKEVLTTIETARVKAVNLASEADKAIANAKVAELEYRVIVQQVYLSNKLDAECKIDPTTGVITWPEEPVTVEGIAG
jgi:hypothetical protein